MVINAIIGTGFFAIPHTYYHSGLIFSLLMTFFCSVFSGLSAIWTLDVVARARGYSYSKENGAFHTSNLNKFTYKRIEFSKFAFIFTGKWGQIACAIILCCYCFGTLWAYCSVFSSTTANLMSRYILSSSQECIIESDPTSQCRLVYSLCVVFFAVCVSILQIFELSKISFVQVFFTIYRFVAFTLIVVSCIISFAFRGSPWTKDPSLPNWASFQMAGFPTLFSSASVALNCAFNIPGILTPLKSKKNAGKAAIGAIATSALIYGSVASIIALALGPDVLQFVMLNWAMFGKKGFEPLARAGGSAEQGLVQGSWWSNIIKIVVMLFPMMSTLSSFPITAGTVGFSLLSSLPVSFQTKLGKAGPIIFRFGVSVIPFILAILFPVLGFIIQFSGLFAIVLISIIPPLFEIISKRKCGMEQRTPYSGWWSHDVVCVIALVYGVGTFIYSFIQFVMRAARGETGGSAH
eukprot:MONOS_10420.1-p1 / transcript=MONOS_10420.1 / gene=MONOS_10420 / organism=Monocercomonoides_exilis_PA203 / gene_product=amino acid transporter, putative / transcript_product=amino acid transporter, putative / location=Mono_scaffold00474:5939-7478(+) / protein_length=463 / sequence_SO=supercontig / SO=protein_coding / is_pseudo=false